MCTVVTLLTIFQPMTVQLKCRRDTSTLQLWEQILAQDSRQIVYAEVWDLHHAHDYSCLNNPLNATLQWCSAVTCVLNSNQYEINITQNYALEYLENQYNYSYVSLPAMPSQKISPGATLQTKWCLYTSSGLQTLNKLSVKGYWLHYLYYSVIIQSFNVLHLIINNNNLFLFFGLSYVYGITEHCCVWTREWLWELIMKVALFYYNESAFIFFKIVKIHHHLLFIVLKVQVSKFKKC